MRSKFAADVRKFRDLTNKAMKYVAVSAIQDVVEGAQTSQASVKLTGTFSVGKIPVDTSDLINSLTSEGIPGAESYSTALLGYTIGDYMRFEWTMSYAIPVALGFHNEETGAKMEGRHFVGTNAAKFSDFVDDRQQEVRR